MFFRVLLAWALFGGMAFGFEPVNVRFGEVAKLEVTQTIDFDWATKIYGEKPTLKPGEGFVIVSVRVAPNKSIGMHDYSLDGQPCLAMSIGGTNVSFSPVMWQYVGQPGDVKPINLLYQVPTEGKSEFIWHLTFDIPSVPDGKDGRNIVLSLVSDQPKTEDGEAKTEDGETKTEDGETKAGGEAEKPAAGTEAGATGDGKTPAKDDGKAAAGGKDDPKAAVGAVVSKATGDGAKADPKAAKTDPKAAKTDPKAAKTAKTDPKAATPAADPKKDGPKRNSVDEW